MSFVKEINLSYSSDEICHILQYRDHCNIHVLQAAKVNGL
jgi:hypothetical protein